MNKLPHNGLRTIAVLTLVFFLGRASRPYQYILEENLIGHFSNSYQTNPFEVQSFYTNLPLELSDSTKVYRCGQSKIYHPTKRHSSFKRCKSKVYVLTVKNAKALGMRHCKCSG